MEAVESLETAEPLQLHDKLTDDWVKPLGCNHVVVKVQKDQMSGKKKEKSKAKKKKKHSKDKDKSEFDDEVSVISFCVMCGELVTETSDSDLSTVENLHTHREGSSLSLQGDAVDSRRQIFRRKASSSTMTSSQMPTAVAKACLIHGHKKIKYFCEDHQEICCSVCVSVLHRGCDRVMFIKDELQNGWDMRVCEDTIKALHVIAKSFEQILSHNEEARKNLQDQVQQFKIKREQIRARLVKLLDDFDITSEKLVKKFVKVTEQEINTTIDTCNDAIKDIATCTDMLESATSCSSEKDAFIATQKVLKQKSKYGVALSEAIKHSKSPSIEFAPQCNIENIQALTKIGDVIFYAEDVIFPEIVLSSVSKIPKSDMRSPRNVMDAFTRSESVSSLDNQVNFVSKFNVRLADDKSVCENVSATFLPDDKVAILDMKNRKLKVFDSRFTKASVVELSSEPRGITVISPLEVAVTLPDESRIQFVSTGKRLTTIRSILTSLPCYGIACHNQELIVLCDDGFSITAIQVLDFEGKELRMMKMDKTGKSAILKNPWHLAVNLDGQNVCVTDRGRLICVDFKGKTIFEYVSEELQNARGLAADDMGRYYVCGTGSGNVHQVSPEGKKLAIILNENDVPSPQAVCYQPARRHLLLTNVGDDFVYLYKMAKP